MRHDPEVLPEEDQAYLEWLCDEHVENDQVFLAKLKKARLDSGLSIEHVAERMGLPPSEIEEFESSYGNPSLRTIRLYATAVGAKVEYHVQPSARAIYDWFYKNEKTD